MFAFVLYAVMIWYAAARWRRQWRSFATVLAGFAGLVAVGWVHYRLNVITHGEICLPVLQVLLYPYALLVVSVGLFISVLRRDPIPHAHCPGCEYDLRGLDAPVENCPECGMTEELARFIEGRAFNGFPAAAEPCIIPESSARPLPAPALPQEGPQWPATAGARVCLDPAVE